MNNTKRKAHIRFFLQVAYERVDKQTTRYKFCPHRYIRHYVHVHVLFLTQQYYLKYLGILNLSLGKVALDSPCKSSAADAATPQAHA